VAIVKPGCAWPRRSDTTLIGVPIPTSSEAWVWRRSWKRMRGRPSFVTCRSKSWVSDSEWIASPLAFVKMGSAWVLDISRSGG
jgi:hypothetical protein